MPGDCPAFPDKHNRVAGVLTVSRRAYGPKPPRSRHFALVNAFRLEKVNDPDQLVSLNSLPPLVSVMKS